MHDVTVALGVRDFDFLIGVWTINNRRLARRLVGSQEWEDFWSTAECRLILDGCGNIDEIKAPEHGLFGMRLRLFDPARREWSLYWANSHDGILQPPVVGWFSKGRGEFYGDDRYEGRSIRVRYIWSEITPISARWEQAFSLDRGKSWETNWVMDFVRNSP